MSNVQMFQASGPLIRQTRLLIDGEFVDAASGRTFVSINPANETCITELAEADAVDVDRAVHAARRAFDQGPWSTMDPRERGRLIHRLADLVDAHAEELARLESLDGGKPIADTAGWEIPAVAETLRYYAGWADKIHGQTLSTRTAYFTHTRREPMGVCAQIIPWNFPLCMLAWKWAPALACGCTLVLKPAEQTPLTALRMGELAVEAGFPDGVINILPGDGPTTGAALVRHPLVDKVAFTGEVRTAQTIIQEAAPTMKRVTIEAGGKSPNIVFADADIDAAVDGACNAIFLNQGQNCCAGSRLLLQREIYEPFIEKLADKARRRRLGDPLDPATEHGPQVDREQFDKVLGYIKLGIEQGARLVVGGERALNPGYFVEPTIFADVRDEMAICTDEIFGPVVCAQPFDTRDEVIARANATRFGLAAAVWTRDLDQAHAVAHGVRAGTVWINCYNVIDCAAPFGGFKASGIGRELGEAALSNYTEIKTITLQR